MKRFLDRAHQHVKRIRNDLVLSAYLRKNAEGEQAFIDSVRASGRSDFIVVIAFEQPLVTGWMLELAQKYLQEYELLIMDNSRNPIRREEIKEVCQKFGAFYLGLPPNKTKHVNRSHGLAMTWVFHHVIKKIEPDTFGFLDHDMLPIKRIQIKERLLNQPCYGVLNPGNGAWNLWAGYCFYRYADVKDKNLNFLYDFSKKLDTGGRNWESFYSKLDGSRFVFGEKEQTYICIPSKQEKQMKTQLVDSQWAHIGSIGYNDNFLVKHDFYAELIASIRGGAAYSEIVQVV